MNFDDFKTAWRAQAIPTHATDIGTAQSIVKAHEQHLHRRLRFDDLLRASPGLLGFVAMVYVHRPLFAVASLILGAFYFLIEKRRLGTVLKSRAPRTLIDQIQWELTEIRHDRWLIVGLPAWYLIPILGAVSLVALQLIRRFLDLDFFFSRPHSQLLVTIITSVCLLFGYALRWRQIKSSHRAVTERIQELERMKAEWFEIKS